MNINRRDFVKSSLAITCAGLAAGCARDIRDENISSEDIELIPKKTGIYEFSAPLPFEYDVIDRMAKLNDKYKKSKIVTLYNCAPSPLADSFNKCMQAGRGFNPDIKSYEDIGKYIKHAQKNGFKVSYLLNSPKAFTEEDYSKIKSQFTNLLDFLKNIGIDEIKYGNTQTASLINEHKDFKLSASTCLELHNITQYKNLIHNYPNTYLIDVSEDETHNFPFLKNLKQMFPSTKIELMVNEVCFKGCPARISHPGGDFCVFDCLKINEEMTPFQNFYHTPVIYPWNLEYYSALGINNFKFSSTPQPRANFNDLGFIKFYLNCIEYGIEKVTAMDFINFMINKRSTQRIKISKDIMLKDIMPYLLDVKQFVKHGHECAVNCGTVCNYCDNMAKKMEKFLGIEYS